MRVSCQNCHWYGPHHYLSGAHNNACPKCGEHKIVADPVLPA